MESLELEPGQARVACCPGDQVPGSHTSPTGPYTLGSSPRALCHPCPAGIGLWMCEGDVGPWGPILACGSECGLIQPTDQTHAIHLAFMDKNVSTADLKHRRAFLL